MKPRDRASCVVRPALPLALAGAACLVFGACSDNTAGGEPSMSTGGASASAGTGASGGQSGSGGTGGGGAGAAGVAGTGASSATTSKYEACLRYVAAQCNRRNFECGNVAAVDEPCPEAMDRCPDFLFSEGSQLTVEAVLACAERWKTYPCEEVNAGRYLDCDLPAGTRAIGESCRFARQCASGACGGPTDSEHPECGECIPIGNLGDTCYMARLACPNGTECTSAGCQAAVSFNLPPGATCERIFQCAPGYRCADSSSGGPQTCQAIPASGETCTDVPYCSGDSYCSTSGMCVSPPSGGEPCAIDVNGIYRCAADALCDEVSPTPMCAERKNAGEDCQPPADGGDPQADCKPGLFCRCTDASCVSGTCYERRHLGEGCDGATVACVPGTTCAAGLCEAVESQGLFQQACPG